MWIISETLSAHHITAWEVCNIMNEYTPGLRGVVPPPFVQNPLKLWSFSCKENIEERKLGKKMVRSVKRAGRPGGLQGGLGAEQGRKDHRDWEDCSWKWGWSEKGWRRECLGRERDGSLAQSSAFPWDFGGWGPSLQSTEGSSDFYWCCRTFSGTSDYRTAGLSPYSKSRSWMRTGFRHGAKAGAWQSNWGCLVNSVAISQLVRPWMAERIHAGSSKADGSASAKDVWNGEDFSSSQEETARELRGREKWGWNKDICWPLLLLPSSRMSNQHRAWRKACNTLRKQHSCTQPAQSPEKCCLMQFFGCI